MSKPLRALLIAEAANPEWVSVPLVGWSIANALREVAEIHIVTQVRNRDAIVTAGLIEGQDFTAIDTEKLARPMWKLSEGLRMGKGVGWTITTAVSSLTYGYFERKVWQRFGAEVRSGRYDIVHRITPLSPTANSSLAVKCAAAGVPFVLGPLNGGVPWPKGFGAERRSEREWLSYVRGAYRLRPGRQAMLKAASAIICGSRHTQSEIPAEFQDKTIWLPENAIDPGRFNMTAPQDGNLPLRACFVGRLVPYKGADMTIMAAADLLRDGRMTLDIIGDGPQRAELDALVDREGLGHAIRFHGWLDHGDVQRVVARTQILTFPSVREFGGGVVLEAMGLGVVPVVVDYAGPGELVDPSVGFKVPMGSRDQIVAGLRDTLQKITDAPDMLPAIAKAAQDRVTSDFTWSAKARQIAAVWEAVIAGKRPLPPVLPR